MVTLKKLTEEDVNVIRSWPLYPPQVRALDYALRKDGWLDEFQCLMCQF